MGFTHQLTKVTLNVTKDETIETLNGLGVNIKGISTEGEFNLADGTLTATAGTNNKDVAMYIDAQGTTATATAIILPTAASTDQTSLNLTFNLNGQSFTHTISDASIFEKGTNVSFNAKLSINNGKPVVTVGNATINNWTEKPGGDINVDPEPEPEPGINLLTNPGFEDWTSELPTAWDNATYNTGEIVKETSIKHGGNNSLRQTSASGTNKIQQEVAITAGKKYRISYWFLDNDTKASSRYWFAMVGSDGKTINDINKQIQQSDYSADNAEWQQVTIEFTAPAGTVKMRYEVRTYRNMDSNEAGGYIYYDDMELVEIQ